MNRLSFLRFLNRYKSLFIISLLIITPLAFIFDLSTKSLVDTIISKPIGSNNFIILTYLYPFYLSIIIVFTIGYTYACKDQVKNMIKRLKILEYSGEEKNYIRKLIISFYGLIYIIIIVFGFLLNTLDVYFLMIPTILLIIELLSLKFELNKLR